MARPRGSRSIGGWTYTPAQMESAGLLPEGSTVTKTITQSDGSTITRTDVKQGIPNPIGILERMTTEKRQEAKQNLRDAKRTSNQTSVRTKKLIKQAAIERQKDLGSMPKTAASVRKFFGLDGKIDDAWRRGDTVYVSKGDSTGIGKTYQEAAYSLASMLNMLPSQKNKTRK